VGFWIEVGNKGREGRERGEVYEGEIREGVEERYGEDKGWHSSVDLKVGRAGWWGWR